MANLAASVRLDLICSDPDDLARLAREMSGSIGFLDILNEIDTAGVEPLYSPLREVPGPRPDRPELGAADPDDLLGLAPDRVGRFFAVPKII